MELALHGGSLVAELVEPGLRAEALGERIAAARARIAAAFEAVCAAGSIEAIAR